MGFFFRKGDTPRAKAVTVVFYLLTFGGIYGFLRAPNFIRNDLVEQVTWPLSFAISTIWVVLLGQDRHPKNKLNSYGPIKWLSAMGLVWLICLGICWGLISYGIPSLATTLAGVDASASATVQRVQRERSGRARGCPYRLEIQANSITQGGFAPCVDKEVWDTVSQGDQVNLRLKVGAFGIKVEEVQLATSAQR